MERGVVRRSNPKALECVSGLGGLTLSIRTPIVAPSVISTNHTHAQTVRNLLTLHTSRINFVSSDDEDQCGIRDRVSVFVTINLEDGEGFLAICCVGGTLGSLYHKLRDCY